MFGESHNILLFVISNIPIICPKIVGDSQCFNECRIKVQSFNKVRQFISCTHLEIDDMLVLIRTDYGLADLLTN